MKRASSSSKSSSRKNEPAFPFVEPTPGELAHLAAQLIGKPDVESDSDAVNRALWLWQTAEQVLFQRWEQNRRSDEQWDQDTENRQLREKAIVRYRWGKGLTKSYQEAAAILFPLSPTPEDSLREFLERIGHAFESTRRVEPFWFEQWSIKLVALCEEEEKKSRSEKMKRVRRGSSEKSK